MLKFSLDPSKAFFILSIVIVALLIILGLMLMFSERFSYIPSNFRFIIGFFVIAYGSFRLVTIYYKSKSKRDENEM